MKHAATSAVSVPTLRGFAWRRDAVIGGASGAAQFTTFPAVHAALFHVKLRPSVRAVSRVECRSSH